MLKEVFQAGKKKIAPDRNVDLQKEKKGIYTEIATTWYNTIAITWVNIKYVSLLYNCT